MVETVPTSRSILIVPRDGDPAHVPCQKVEDWLWGDAGISEAVEPVSHLPKGEMLTPRVEEQAKKWRKRNGANWLERYSTARPSGDIVLETRVCDKSNLGYILGRMRSGRWSSLQRPAQGHRLTTDYARLISKAYDFARFRNQCKNSETLSTFKAPRRLMLLESPIHSQISYDAAFK